jgi:hypothetical protein
MPRNLKTGAVSQDTWCIYLKGAPAMFKSGTERTVLFSTTKAETYVGVSCFQDML